MTNHRKTIAAAAILAAIGIILGAFGAHALKKILSPTSLEAFKTGVYYHQLHAVALLVIGVLMHALPNYNRQLTHTARLLAGGVVLFSGSLYVLSFKDILGFNAPIIGILTPIGGVFFVAGWCYMAYIFIKK